MKFPEYKGLDLPNVADNILQYWQKYNILANLCIYYS